MNLLTETQRNHVVCLAFLFSCQRTDFRRKGGQFARPSRPCQAKCFRARSLAPEPISVDSDCFDAGVGKSFRRRVPRGPQILGPVRLDVNVAPGTVTTLWATVLFQPTASAHCVFALKRPRVARDHLQPDPPRSYFSVLMHNLLCRLQLRLGFQRSFSALGTHDNG